MTAKTRLGNEGYGVRRVGVNAFAGKTTQAHPVTRLSSDGYGARRYASGAFAGKTTATVTAGTRRRILFIANVGRLMN